MTLSTQAIVFGTMLCTGILLGFWLDLFRLINRRGKAPYLLILDLLFWVVIICAVFIVLYITNHLELRFYVFFSLGLGLALYLKIFSRHILQLYIWGFELIIKMLKWLGRVFRPLTLPARLVSGLVDLCVEVLLNLGARLFVTVFQRNRQDNPPLA